MTSTIHPPTTLQLKDGEVVQPSVDPKDKQVDAKQVDAEVVLG